MRVIAVRILSFFRLTSKKQTSSCLFICSIISKMPGGDCFYIGTHAQIARLVFMLASKTNSFYTIQTLSNCSVLKNKRGMKLAAYNANDDEKPEYGQEALIATINNENEIVNSLRLLKESERQRKNSNHHITPIKRRRPITRRRKIKS